MPDILCLVPSSLEYLRDQCVPAILSQTVPVKMLVVLPVLSQGGTIDDRLIKTLNDGLKVIDLHGFDYLLRVDGDAVLPPNFVEEAIKSNADVYGSGGYAMLIKVSTFIEAMGGRFRHIDDSYLKAKFLTRGFKVVNESIPVEHKPKVKKTVRTVTRSHIHRGVCMHKMGYEPIHVLHAVFKHPPLIICAYSYFLAKIRRVKKLDVADFVFRYQVKRLFDGRT